MRACVRQTPPVCNLWAARERLWQRVASTFTTVWLSVRLADHQDVWYVVHVRSRSYTLQTDDVYLLPFPAYLPWRIRPLRQIEGFIRVKVEVQIRCSYVQTVSFRRQGVFHAPITTEYLTILNML